MLTRWLQLLHQGNLAALHAQTLMAGPAEARPRTNEGGDAARAAAGAKLKQGQLSRARQMLTAAALAPGDDSTLRALTDPARRPPQLLRPLTPDVLTFTAAEEVTLTVAQVADALRSTKRGSAAGLSRATIELYTSFFWTTLRCSSRSRSRAQAPQIAQDAIAMSRLTALRKPGGGVRGIAPGDVFQRLVARALARAYAAAFDEAAPFQFALHAGDRPHHIACLSAACRSRRRNAKCMRSRARVVAASAGMAASHMPAAGPDWDRRSAREAGWQAAAHESVKCESGVPLPAKASQPELSLRWWHRRPASARFPARAFCPSRLIEPRRHVSCSL